MPEISEPEAGDTPVIVFDALCVLCVGQARFVLRQPALRHVRLASVQGTAGRALCIAHGIDPDNPDSMMWVERGRVLRDSDAVLAIYAASGWPLRGLARVVRAVPRAVRDPVYRWVGRNRYRWFGRREVCWLPEPGDLDRLL